MRVKTGHNIKGLKLLIFDLDGTLIDSKADVGNAINRTLEKYGFPVLDEDRIWKYLGDGAFYLVDRCFGYYDAKAPDGSVEYFIEDYRNNYLVHTVLYPGILDTLKKLGGFKKAILTNKIQDITLKICDGMGITPLFDYIVGRGRFKKKPDPQGVRDILARLKTCSEDSAIIGDTTIDMQTADNAGLRKIAVTWGVHDRDTLLKSRPDAIVDNAEELKALLI